MRELERELRGLLRDVDDVRFDRAQFQSLAHDVAVGRLSPESNRLATDPVPVERSEVGWLSELSPEIAHVGERALADGRVAACVLNGGMATRFGGVVKGAVPAIGGQSFLEIKCQQARRASRAPFAIMNSFATSTATRAHLREKGLESRCLPFLQSVSLRLTREGRVFRSPTGELSPYAPGHGDFIGAIRESGTLDRLRAVGVDTLMLSNVDNLGADLDPRVIGFHLSGGAPLTVELAETLPGDVGGAPARVAGRLQVVEGFRFPAGFDFARLPVMNTNTFVMSLDVLDQEPPLSWFYVEKQVDSQVAVQLERLVGELSAFVETRYLASPRSGPDCRFFPVKAPKDLEELRANPDVLAKVTPRESSP